MHARIYLRNIFTASRCALYPRPQLPEGNGFRYADGVIVGSGIDLCEVPRIEEAITRYGARFLERLFTPHEIAYADRKANRFERYAARFAAKEAGMKALGTGWRGGITWRDFEVANLPSGRPTLRFYGKAAEIAEKLGVHNIALSLTHTREQAMAVVILES
jgi:holo-[acyl-carrier protein] synthase